MQVHLEEGRALPRPGFVFNSHATANDHEREAVDERNDDDVIDSTVVWGEKLHV